MKKLMLAAVLCTAAFVLAPIASASAETKGTCHINGTATFKEPLSEKPKAETTYNFESEAGAKCEAEAGFEKITVVKVTIEGKGNLSCPVGMEEGPGSGKFIYKTEAGVEKTDTFSFKFRAAAGVVTFETEGEVKSSGKATFLFDPASKRACFETVPPKASSLKFEAETTGTIK